MDYYIGSLRPQSKDSLSIGPNKLLVTQNTGKTAWLPATDFVPSTHYHKKGVHVNTQTFPESTQYEVNTEWTPIEGHTINASGSSMIRCEWYGNINYTDKRAIGVNIPLIALAKNGVIDTKSIRYPSITIGHSGTSRAILTTTTDSNSTITLVTSIRKPRSSNPYTASILTRKSHFQTWKLN
jgi:hypothetical protein